MHAYNVYLFVTESNQKKNMENKVFSYPSCARAAKRRIS